ncbi:efflux RND transporter periplasmic adaptor subunit [bacterium]|nr:efflux RND transporter periplasmic adaptor subunit [bacterium]
MIKFFLIVLTISLAFSNCSEKTTAETQKTEETKNVSVQTINLNPSHFSEFLEVMGTIKAKNQIQLVAEEGGTLKRIIREKGSNVSKGDTLAILEGKILEASYKEAKAGLQQVELAFNSSKVLYDKKAISENEFLAKKYELERMEASYELVKARFNKLFIVAPFSGFVNNRFYDLGSYVNPMTPLFELIDNSTVKLSAGIAERFLSDIEKGTNLEITFDAYEDLKIESKVTFVSKSIDQLNRVFEIESEITNKDNKLAPQMVANVKILRKSMQNQIVIPLDAIINSENGSYVFVANQNKAQKINVELLGVYGDSASVTGLETNQKLIVVGQRGLTDGDGLSSLN